MSEQPPATASTPSRRLADLGLQLPAVAAPAGSYQPAVRMGEVVYTAGQLPLVDGVLSAVGRVGDQVSDEQAVAAARLAGLNAIAAAASVADGGDGIDAIRRIVKVVVYVASSPDFVAQPSIANGASELFGAVFGADGVHARSAVGVAALPKNAPVEVELVAELRLA
jgi:enamine deaminase RidA (YjgF/YER057c/UK114 family)